MLLFCEFQMSENKEEKVVISDKSKRKSTIKDTQDSYSSSDEDEVLLAMFKSTSINPETVSKLEKNYVSVLGREKIFLIAPILKILYTFAVPRDYIYILLPFDLKLFKVILFIQNVSNHVQTDVIDKHFYVKWAGESYHYNLKHFCQIKMVIDELNTLEIKNLLKLAIFLQNKKCENIISRIFSHRMIGLYNIATTRNYLNIPNNLQLWFEMEELYEKVAKFYNTYVFNQSRPSMFTKNKKTGDYFNSNLTWKTMAYKVEELVCKKNCELRTIENQKIIFSENRERFLRNFDPPYKKPPNQMLKPIRVMR